MRKLSLADAVSELIKAGFKVDVFDLLEKARNEEIPSEKKGIEYFFDLEVVLEKFGAKAKKEKVERSYR